MQKNNWLPSFSVLYLLFPLVLFVYGWVKETISVFLLPVLFVLAGFAIRDLYLSFRKVEGDSPNSGAKPYRRGDILKWGIAFLVILAWVLLSGSGGFGFQNMDYNASNALLKDLIEQPWPLTVQWEGAFLPVVYYMGWYLPAALVGKILGWSAGNIFSFFWTLLGVFLSFLWFLRSSTIKNLTTGRMLVTLLVFCLADGLDFLMIDSHNWGFFQYSAQTILIYWVPQHTVPAWLVTGLVVDCIYGRLSTVKYLVVALAACFISSPFGVIGIVPYLFIFGLMSWRAKQYQAVFSFQSIALNAIAVPFGLIGLFYLSSNKYSFPMGFLWEFIDFSPILFAGWFEFCLIEFGILFLFIFLALWFDHSTLRRKVNLANRLRFSEYLETIHGISTISYVLFVTSAVVLFLLPIYKMGYRSDLSMRASIPSLFIFWSFVSRILVDSGFNRNSEIRLFYVMVICSIMIGFYLSLFYIWQSITHYHFGPPDKNSVLTTVTANPPWIVEQRIGNSESSFYRYFSK